MHERVQGEKEVHPSQSLVLPDEHVASQIERELRAESCKSLQRLQDKEDSEPKNRNIQFIMPQGGTGIRIPVS